MISITGLHEGASRVQQADDPPDTALDDLGDKLLACLMELGQDRIHHGGMQVFELFRDELPHATPSPCYQ